MLAENIPPKYWKWAEAKLLGIPWLKQHGFTLTEYCELQDAGMTYRFYFGRKYTRRLTLETLNIILERLEQGKMYLDLPLKIKTKEELREIILQNAVTKVAGWGAYWQYEP